MEWINYHHLLYFWTVVRAGSIGRASEQLRLAPPTISAQLRSLEGSFGEKLLTRSARGVQPTEIGQIVYRYADDIFSLGREMLDTIKDRPTGHPMQLVVGIADVLPKEISYALIAPALQLREPVQITCREDNQEHLLANLAIQELDVVLSDTPIGPPAKVRAYNHLLGECGMTFFATPELSEKYGRRFPKVLHGAPILLPADNTNVRRALDQWFDSQQIRPLMVGQFEDFALLRHFGEAGAGIFAVPSVLEKQFRREGKLRLVGRAGAVLNRFYAISVERKLKHPAVVAICETARHELFS
ncbi:MAG: transcriptional activator NhaR [Acidobacteriia bacterium]|nr:transcriptional activator NhaR [Terriglobia bacterium]